MIAGLLARAHSRHPGVSLALELPERKLEPRRQPSDGFTPRQALLVYLGFAAGVIAVTWPLVLHPATLWPPHHDSRVFSWVMTSMARRLFTAPLHLFHGNAFYPFGDSLAFTEVLLPPSLLGLPGFLWASPILTYNVLLLLLWPLNGLTAAWLARKLTGSHAGAWLAGAVFCLSPYFTEYYLEFQMLLAAAIPVILLAWVRWLETAERRWLVLTLGGLALQALTTWYYGVIVGLALVFLGLGVLCLRWAGWQWWRRVELLPGLLGVVVVILPFALPYFTVYRELGFERTITETAAHYGDLASFVEPGWRSILYRFAPADHVPETSAFVGFAVLALAAASLVGLRRDPPLARPARWIARAATAGLVVAAPAFVWAAVIRPAQYKWGPISVHVRPGHFLDLVVILGFVLLAARGWTAYRAGTGRRLTQGDWVCLLLALTGVFVVLSLGPIIHVAGWDLGPGPYLAFYRVLLPLHVVRVTIRFAVIAVLGLGLLAAFGMRALEDRLAGRPRLRRLAIAAVFAALGLEYAVAPATYEVVTAAPRPVDLALRADPAEGTVIEFPIFFGDSDADAMFRSLTHGKYVVNGLSGFTPERMRELSGLLSARGEPFPIEDAQAALRRIYPLRYLVVRLADPAMPRRLVPDWIGLRARTPSLLRFRGTFGTEDLYEVIGLPQRDTLVEREVSYDFLVLHPVLRVAVQPVMRTPRREQWIDVRLNDAPVRRIPLDAPTATTVRLDGPRRYAAPNVVALDYGYERPPHARDGRYRIGATGAASPADLHLRSGGQPYGDVGSVRVNGREWAVGARGYNLVALDPDGRVRAAAVFDTCADPHAARQLAAFVAALPPGTVVAGAVKDEGSAHLTQVAVDALRALGAVHDLRGRYRESHAFVGVKGAPPGTAVEARGPQLAEVTVGQLDDADGFQLDSFALEPERPAEGSRPGRSR
jgi:hypothetical protein